MSIIAPMRRKIWVPPSGPRRVVEVRKIATHSADGRPYEPCPAPGCRKFASLKSIERGVVTTPHEVWRCESCGYVDCDTCPLGDHEKN